MSSVPPPGCPRVVSRQEWGARDRKVQADSMAATPHCVVIHHANTSPCFDQDSCTRMVQTFQRYHMSDPPTGRGWNDIGYNFVVGEDGRVYEGRGWGETAAHAKGFNDVSIGICVIGDFSSRVPNDAALSAVKQLIQCGVANGQISPHYTLKGHRDVGSTECPGQALYSVIQSWHHYAPGKDWYKT